MFTDRLWNDEAWHFATSWGGAVAEDFCIGWRRKKEHEISIFRIVLEYKGYDRLMAKRTQDTPTQSAKKQLLWLRVDVSDDMVQKAIEASSDHADLFGTIGALVVLGFGVSIKPANDGTGAMATILKDADDDQRQPLGLSAFAPDYASATALLLCKFYDCLDGQWNTPSGSTASKWR